MTKIMSIGLVVMAAIIVGLIVRVGTLQVENKSLQGQLGEVQRINDRSKAEAVEEAKKELATELTLQKNENKKLTDQATQLQKDLKEITAVACTIVPDNAVCR